MTHHLRGSRMHQFKIRRFASEIRVELSGASLASVEFDDNQQSLTSSTPTVLDISVDLGPVNVTLCTAEESNYLCVFVRHQNETASFRDDVIGNNIQCMDMATNKVCHPGKMSDVVAICMF